MTVLVARGQPDEDHLDQLSARLAALEASLSGRLAEMDAARASLEAFRIRYHQEVGLLHDRLDELELAIAEAELGELAAKVGTSSRAEHRASSDPHATREPAPRYTTDGVRKLFRDVAKAIHPDLAGDETARTRRHRLMVEANRAYLRGDAERLRWILQTWEKSPETVPDTDPAALRLRLMRRIAEIEEHLATLADEWADLQASPLWQLKVMVDQAAARGKDIVQDMVGRLKRDIMAATNRLDAMRPPS